MAEDFMTAAVKRVEAQFAKSGVSESYAAFERKDSQIEMRDGVKPVSYTHLTLPTT